MSPELFSIWGVSKTLEEHEQPINAFLFPGRWHFPCNVLEVRKNKLQFQNR